ncbi:uncharacterized protein C8Q71DRAFT_858770 [Rhodofomes roseus]|uniref:Uncharacterized protein n=1 Tax=Rhodofomes roseus TaxID=34475 RepID=A0ABQ8KEU0_9APHY|nr:uncharacterized protein C8Q71DRAFT_858770 [Rhodofomes roseus]KAH9835938.1 hypothetical protein C8Q71DRAFT_858770 [Rhodofomes roseus]
MLCSDADSEPDALLLSRLSAIACTCALRSGSLDICMTPAGQLRFDKLSTLVRIIPWPDPFPFAIGAMGVLKSSIPFELHNPSLKCVVSARCAHSAPRTDEHARSIILDCFFCSTPRHLDMAKAAPRQTRGSAVDPLLAIKHLIAHAQLAPHAVPRDAVHASVVPRPCVDAPPTRASSLRILYGAVVMPPVHRVHAPEARADDREDLLELIGEHAPTL